MVNEVIEEEISEPSGRKDEKPAENKREVEILDI